mgnify:FL=1
MHTVYKIGPFCFLVAEDIEWLGYIFSLSLSMSIFLQCKLEAQCPGQEHIDFTVEKTKGGM